MAEQLLFMGDIKGTRSALMSLNEGGREDLTNRLQSLHDSFAQTFDKFSQRSRSVVGVTISDSVIAYWGDASEGRRYAVDFMRTLWCTLDRSILRFRGFLDIGEFIQETSVASHALTLVHDRFAMTLPVSVAAWSVAVAEQSHFPEGLFVSKPLAAQLPDAQFGGEMHAAGSFEFLQLVIGSQY